jgi:hypothetical protein
LTTLEQFQSTAVYSDLMIIGHFIVVAFKNVDNLLNLKITEINSQFKELIFKLAAAWQSLTDICAQALQATHMLYLRLVPKMIFGDFETIFGFHKTI